MNHKNTKTQNPPIPRECNEAAKIVVDAAYTVHSTLGPGLFESIYETCLAHELSKRGLKVLRQVTVPIVYGGVRLGENLRLDLLVQDRVIVEVKAVDSFQDVHLAQILTYLKLTSLRLGLLINFNVLNIGTGIRRVVL